VLEAIRAMPKASAKQLAEQLEKVREELNTLTTKSDANLKELGGYRDREILLKEEIQVNATKACTALPGSSCKTLC
jgi:hypothetical protein